jgi:hypothetical protein
MISPSVLPTNASAEMPLCIATTALLAVQETILDVLEKATDSYCALFRADCICASTSEANFPDSMFSLASTS